MTLSFYDILSLFLLYSFLGWCTEVIYAAVTTGKVINRGFLNGPVCPIYGFGMIGVLLFLDPIADNTLLLFFAGMVLCSAIELIGGWALKQFFHTRWWDYSQRPLNIGGYVCLGFSIIWGLAVVFVIRLIQPVLLDTVELAGSCLPTAVVWILLCILYAAFIADLVLTLITIIGLQKKLQELEKIAEALHGVSDELSDRLGKGALAADARFDRMMLTGKERLEAEKEEMESAISDSREYLEMQKAKLQDAVSEERELMEARRERAEASFTAKKQQMEQSIADGRKKLQTTIEEGREKRSEQRGQRTEAHQKRAMQLEAEKQALVQRRTHLENRRKELVLSINRPRFGMRRLIDAFPALHSSLKDRIGEPHGPEEK